MYAEPAAAAIDDRNYTPPLAFARRGLDNGSLLALYESILLPRMIEEKMLVLLRANKISKWFSGIGQEAIAGGVVAALGPRDYIFPLHRNLGVFTGRNMPLKQLFCQWQGKPEGFTKGRDRSFHFGSEPHRVIGMISHLGAMLGVADGAALGMKLAGQDGVCVAFSGDGGASEGEFHEAVNVAAVWDLPVIFLIENNGYGLSTPSSEQFRCRQFIDKAIGYGMEGVQVDGNDVLAVYHGAKEIVDEIRRNPRPFFLECMTFRMRGHEEASGTKYVPAELMDYWAKKDPVVNFENFLLREGVLDETTRDNIRAALKTRIDTEWKAAFDAPDVTPDLAEELRDVYAPSRATPAPPAPATPAPETRYVDAITDALRIGMERNPKLVLMGQDIADYGGVFKVTQGFVEQFGRERVRNTPLCEAAILAAGFGLSLEGYTSMVEMQFADFVSCGFNQIVNNLAKTYYRWGHSPAVVVRMPTGGGVAAGPFHSQSDEAWFCHTPGLKVVFPSTAFDAKGLLLTALEDGGPVIFFEHKKLYRSVQDAVPQGYYSLPFGKARVVREGADLTIVTYGMGVQWAEAAAQETDSGAVEIIDLRTLAPWDKDAVFASVRKTGKCLVLHEATHTAGFGAELAATISEALFPYLDGPVRRLASLDSPVPFNAALENQFFPAGRLKNAVQALLAY